MSEPLSILEKIIESEKSKQLQELDIVEEVNYLLLNPKIKKDREREVIRLRYGLNGDKIKTLEEIGHQLGITRERVRQIEKAAMKKIADFAANEKRTEKVLNLISEQIKEVGGIITFSDFCELVMGDDCKKPKFRSSLNFLMIMNKKVVQTDETSRFKKAVILSAIKTESIVKTIEDAIRILEDNKSAVEENKLIKKIKAEKVRLDSDIAIVSALSISKEILRTEEGHFGLSNWRDINPKSIKDKTYYILKKHNKPLHFEEISKHVETLNENKKKVTKQAVHNELIRDERFVLIGRGIYALKEWGYKGGVIEEVIEEILIQAGGPLHKNIIIEEVLKKRIVKETTILLNLQKKKFKRTARATYTINK